MIVVTGPERSTRTMARTLLRARAVAPGRVNLVGEHTDYNDGLCLPFAIGRGVTVTAQALGEPRVEVLSEALGERDAFTLDGVRAAGGWRAYPRGVVAELRAEGRASRGARLRIASDLPAGAGLGSSAALCVALALALLALDGEQEPDLLALARLCSRVEHDWAGAQTGLLDQLAVLLAEPGHALRLDLRDLRAQPVPLELGGRRLVTVDSGVRHAHAEGAYNRRRAECREGCRALGLASLRDATEADAARLPEPLDRRVRHVVTENARVEAAADALRRGDVAALGPLLDASHASLRDDYEVSLPEVDHAVAALKAAGADGARMIGGGFGGSILALLAPGAATPPGAVDALPGPGARSFAE
jgi:galactokinase